MQFKNLNYWAICETHPKTIQRTKKAIRTMEVRAVPNPANGHTHVGIIYLEEHMVRYLGKMIDDVFQFDPTTRRVTEWL